jgi:Cu(I)/Ag(I) efflux system membrane fusion protein
VLEKQVLSGQKIMAGEPLFRVADLRRVWIEGELFEQDLATVRLGQTVHADMQALPGEHYMGRITYVYPTLDPETRTARVRMELANADLRLKPGMYATMRVESGRRAAVLTVPRSAVLVTGERSLVFVRGADGRLTPRPVRLGAAGTERIEIHSGLLEGETIVASATFLIDAESNLGGALGAMGAVAAPSGGPGMQSPASSPASGAAGAHDAHPR